MATTRVAGPKAPDAQAVHAAFAVAADVVRERRALYRLAGELVGIDDLTDDLLDHPLVRHRIGEMIAGRVQVLAAELSAARDSIGEVVDVGVRVVADPVAQDTLSSVLSLVGPVAGVRLLTCVDGAAFESAVQTVAAGVRLVREVGGGLADDLLTHVDLVAVLDPETSAGLVSASSRYFPGLVLIDRPSTAIEVAEALVHEGAHQKFFDLAITRSFLGPDSVLAEEFVTSWSGACWQIEQVFAAWHAYQCLAQFADAATRLTTGLDSLLPVARERAAEIGEWLLKHEMYLLGDAKWLLRMILGLPVTVSSEIVVPESQSGGYYAIVSLVRLGEKLRTARRVVGRVKSPPEIFWLEEDPAAVLELLAGQPAGMRFDDGVIALQAMWQVGVLVARDRLSAALFFLVRARLVDRVI